MANINTKILSRTECLVAISDLERINSIKKDLDGKNTNFISNLAKKALFTVAQIYLAVPYFIISFANWTTGYNFKAIKDSSWKYETIWQGLKGLKNASSQMGWFSREYDAADFMKAVGPNHGFLKEVKQLPDGSKKEVIVINGAFRRFANTMQFSANWDKSMEMITRLTTFRNSFCHESSDAEKKLRDAISEVEKAEKSLNEIKLTEFYSKDLTELAEKLKDDIHELRDSFTLSLDLIINEKKHYEEYVVVQEKELKESFIRCTDFDSYFKFLQKAQKIITKIIIGIPIERLSNIDQNIYLSYGNAIRALEILEKEQYTRIESYIDFFTKTLKSNSELVKNLQKEVRSINDKWRDTFAT